MSPSKPAYIVSTFNQDDWYKETVTATPTSPKLVEFRVRGATGTAPLRFAIVNSKGTVEASGVVGGVLGGDILDYFVTRTQVIYVHVYQAVIGPNGGSSPYYIEGF